MPSVSDDPIADRLRQAPASDAVRASVWDAFHAATNEDDLAERLKGVALPDNVKADLWDLKASTAHPAAGGLYDPNRRPASAEDFTAPNTPKGSAVGRFFGGVGDALNPMPLIRGLAAAGRPDPSHPEDAMLGGFAPLGPLVRGVVGGQIAEGKQAITDAKAGRYVEAAGRGLAAAVPMFGPAAATAGEQIGTGDVAGGLGKGAGLIAPVLVGAAVPKALRVPGIGTATDTADALALADRTGVPVDAATASGNKFVKAIQHVSDRSLAGSLVANRAAESQRAGLATLGEQLAAKANARSVTAGEAGSAAQEGVSGVVSTQRGLANDAYARLRAMEADPANASTVQTGTRAITTPESQILDASGNPARAASTQSAPVTETIPMAVDLGDVKAAMRPIADRLAAKKATIGTLLGKEGTAADKLNALLTGPNAVPLSVADSALSDLKAMARTNNPNLRNVGQGIAAKAVSNLSQAVSDAAERAGPDAVSALEDGRTATKAKYAAADVLKRLEGAQQTKSPVTAFRGLTQSGDTSIGHLTDTLTQAPETKPLIARAVLDGLIDSPTAGAAKTFSDWQKIGPETKALLYAPDHVKDLDAFFKLRKMMAENPNPSGTAHTLLTAGQAGLIFTEPVSGTALQIGTGVLSSLLHSPAGVRLLTRGMRIPIKNTAASSAWAADFAAATGAATSPSAPQPSLAGASGR
jgi:hypothetical protein